MAHVQYEPLVGPVLDGASIPPPELSWAPVYPDQLHRAELHEYPYFARPEIEPSAIPPPELAWSPRYPRQLYRTPQGEGFFSQNVEPIGEPAPELSWSPTFPELLLREPQEEGHFDLNLDPIPNPVPDLATVTFPDFLLAEPPPHPPSFFHLDNPTLHRVYEDYSRGLHVGDVRGFYHTMESAHVEPWAVASTINAQSISSGTPTILDIQGGSSFGGFSGSNMNPWALIDTVNDRIVFKHDGYYIVGAQGAWENNSTGRRTIVITVYSAGGVALRVVVADDRAASFVNRTAFSSVPQPFGKGQYIDATVSQTSGGPILTGPWFLSVLRIAPPRLVTPT